MLLGGKGDPGAWSTKGPNTPRFFQIPCCSKFSGTAAPETEGCGPRGHQTSSQENLWLQACSEATFTPCPRVNRRRRTGFQEQRPSLPDARTQGLSVSVRQHRLRKGTHLRLESSHWPSSPNEEKGAVSHSHGIPSLMSLWCPVRAASLHLAGDDSSQPFQERCSGCLGFLPPRPQWMDARHTRRI